jgi:ribokinase
LKSRSEGGSAANTIVALARMGFPTRLIGKVGEDKEGDFPLESLKLAQIDRIGRGQRSGVCLVVLDPHWDRFLFVRGNANSTLTADKINFDALKDISWVYLTSFIGASPFAAQKVLLDRLHPSLKVSMDPGEIYAKKGLNEIRSFIKRCQFLFLTERDVGLLTPQDLRAGVKSLKKAGPSVLVCEKGSQGSHVFTEKGDFEIPTVQVDVVDNTGAGDVCDAGFLAGLFLGRSPEESAHFASVIAAKSVVGYGREQYPTQEDLEEFFRIRRQKDNMERS